MALFSSASSGASISVGGVPRVNLLPRSVSEGRERARLLKVWGWGLVGALLAVVVATGAAFAFLTFNAAQLVTANARTGSLLSDLAALAPVRAQLSLNDDLEDFRTEAMTTDVAWSQVSALVSSVLPEGAAITQVDFTVGAAPQGEDRAAEIGLTGTVNVDSAQSLDIVTVVRALRGTPGVFQVDGWESKPVGAGYSYLLKIDIDQSVYTGAYAEEVAQ